MKNKTAVLYFSGTGNSLFAAKQIAKATNGELLSLATLCRNKNFSLDGETVIIVFPVFIWQAPSLVIDYLKQLSLPEGSVLYAVATYGGMLSRSLKHFEKVALDRGLPYQGGFALQQPGSAQNTYDVFPREKQNKLFTKAEEKLPGIIETIRKKKKTRSKVNLGIFGFLFTYILGPKMIAGVRHADEGFYRTDSCNNCGMCEKICPAHNLTIRDGAFSYAHSCEMCFACMQWCPQKAIQFGQKSETFGRYHHPEVKLQEMLEQSK